jgi:N-methylhydantoinase A
MDVPLRDVNSHRPSDLRLGVDIGGTFTDLVAMDDAGNVTVAKTPSTPRDPAQAVERGVSLLAERLGLSAAGESMIA